MLENILKSVNDAEAQAEEIMKAAEAQAASILEDAKARAGVMREETFQRVKLKNQEMADAMHQEGSLRLEAAAAEAQKEIDALNKLVASKKKEAVQAVLSVLI